MTITGMLGQSGIMALLGMAVVFGFLVIMIIAISLTGKVIHALGWDKDTPTGGSHAAPKRDEVTAAIGAAVNEYKKNN